MATGEGKTLAAVAPVFLQALAGRGAHVLTFNDYLARRDAAWMGPVYERLGLSVGFVQERMSVAERQRAYAADVTYLTAKEAGFDHLRDALALEPAERVQRAYHFALVDEADSILIDEARIPLVIAGETGEALAGPERLAALVRSLVPGRDFDTDEHAHNIALTEAGTARVEAALGVDSLHAIEDVSLHAQLRHALHAEHLLRRDVDYIVRGGRSSSWTSRPAASPTSATGPTGCTPRSRPRRACGSAPRAGSSARSRCSTSCASTRASPA